MLVWAPAADTCAAPGHPRVPTLTLSEGDAPAGGADAAADVLLPPSRPDEWLPRITRAVCETASGRYTPLNLRHGNLDFQVSRGEGVSL